MAKRIDEEKEALKLLESERKKVKDKQPQMPTEGDLNGGFKERLAVIKGQKKIDDKKEEKRDFRDRKNEVYLETPLPSTLSIDMLPIEKINNGIVYLDDGRIVKILEIMPINFLLKNAQEQEEVIFDFEKYLRIAPDNFQVKSLAKRTDISRYIQKIEEEIATETDEKCRSLQEDYRRLLLNIGGTEAVTRRFFIIMEYKRLRGRGFNQKEIESEIEIMTNNCVSYLKSCGNSVLIMDNPTSETARIFFDILNRELNSSTDFGKRVADTYTFYEMNYGEESTDLIPVTEYFAPKDLIFGKNFTKMNNVFYDFLFLKSSGFPNLVPAGWMSMLVNMGEGIDVDLFVKKQPKNKMQERIGRKIRWNISKIRNMNQSTTEYDDVEDAMSSGFYLKSGLQQGGQDFYYINIMITISAKSLSDLSFRRTAVLNYLKSSELYTFSCDFLQKQAFESYLPICKIDKKLFDRSKRNILTEGLASCFPFTSFEMSDEDGVLLGINETNNSLCIADFFNTDVYKNANISIIGTSGAGKTYLLQLLAMRFRRKHIQTFIIAPDKGHEFARATKNIGGEFITISPSSTQCINVMEIRKRDLKAAKALDGNFALNQSELTNKIQSLHIFFKLLIPDLNAEEDQLVDEALIEAYKAKGITHDNASLYKEGSTTEYKEMPLLGDVYNLLKDNPASRRVANIMKVLVDGSAKSFNQQTNVDLSNPYTVIDISNLTGNLLPVGMFLATDAVYSIAKEDRTKRKAIIFDEVWELIGSKSNASAAEYVLEVFKIIRGYGGSAICATQDLEDFFALEGGKYGKGIINNSKTKIILNLENKEAMAVRELLQLSEEEYKKIIRFPKGHGLLSANGNNVPIHFKASDLENDLITTDRRQLERLAAEGVFSEE